VQGMPTISFFLLLLLTLPQAKQHHLSVARTRDGGALLPTTPQPQPLPCSNARRRGSIAHHNPNHDYDPALARTRDGGALLPTTTTTMTPPSLECETEGPYCPPQPQPQPLPRLNVRWRPTTTTTTTPSLLEHETEGLCCPPQPQPRLQPRPCSNARWRGAIAHNHNPNPNPSLARTRDIGL